MINFRLLLLLELVWWVISVIIVYIFIQPVWTNFNNFPFLISNIAFCLIFIHYTRHIFLLEYSLIAKVMPIKLLLIIASIPISMYIVPNIQNFQAFLDNDGTEGLTKLLKNPSKTTEEVIALSKYIRAEFTFFGTGALIAVIVLPIRMLISIWRQRNKGTT